MFGQLELFSLKEILANRFRKFWSFLLVSILNSWLYIKILFLCLFLLNTLYSIHWKPLLFIIVAVNMVYGYWLKGSSYAALSCLVCVSKDKTSTFLVMRYDVSVKGGRHDFSAILSSIIARKNNLRFTWKLE